jgi:ABC-2 type transport system permease protein
MRFKAYFIKTLKENLRDWKILIFTLLFAPCFVLVLYGAYGHSNHSYNVILINRDQTGEKIHSSAVIKLLQEDKYPDGVPKFKLSLFDDTESALEKLKNRSADAVAVIPEELSKTLIEAAANNSYTPAKLKLYGDPRNSRYAVAAILLLTDLDMYVRQVTKAKVPLDYDETLLGEGKAFTDFDFYVPGIIVLAVLNVMFTAGASLIKEVDKGTMQRLILSRLTTGEMFGAISVIQIALGLVSMLLALLVAMACGFEFKGSYPALILVGVLSEISVMGLALITVSFLKSVFDLMTVGVIPYFVVMFFAGVFFPLPQIQIAAIGENIVRLNDLLPLSLAVTALNKVLNFGSGIPDIWFELCGILLVSLTYGCTGLWLFRRRHMKLR